MTTDLLDACPRCGSGERRPSCDLCGGTGIRIGRQPDTRWTFEVSREALTVGFVPRGQTQGRGRWLHVDWRDPHGAPRRAYWHGRQLCWTLGAPSQRFDWARNRWTEATSRLTFHPRNYLERVFRKSDLVEPRRSAFRLH